MREALWASSQLKVAQRKAAPGLDQGEFMPTVRSWGWFRGDGKHKCRPWTIIPHGPYATAVTLDDRATDRQTDAHAAVLGGEERIEKSTCIMGLKADA